LSEPSGRFGARWIVGTVLVGAIVFGCIEAGFWQLRRLDQRRTRNAQVVARSQDLIPLPAAGFARDADTDELEYRRVRVRGTYDPAKEVLVRFRSRQGLPGYEVLTPMVLEGDATTRAVVVDRGWVPLEVGDHWPQAAAAPPTGIVDVEGLLGLSEHGSLRLERARSGTAVVAVVAPDKLRTELGYRTLYAAPLLAEEGGASSSAAYPAPVDPPDLGEGPHFSYTVQWFLFASVGIVGWPLLVFTRGPLGRRRRRPTLPA
jgi:cytochrome oxidase assembly protein ShyY1